MALISATTDPAILGTIANLAPEIKLAAFQAANPLLASTIENLRKNPRAIRNLTAETAQEALGWLTAEEIKGCVAVDTRESIRVTASRVLATANSVLDAGPNSKNIADRTSRAISKGFPTALHVLEGMSAIDESAVWIWVQSLNPKQISEAAATLLKMTTTFGKQAQLVNLCFQHCDMADEHWPQVRDLLRGNAQTVQHLKITWAGPWPATLAEVYVLVAGGEVHPTTHKAPVLSPAAAGVFRTHKAWPLLLWAGLVTETDMPELFNFVSASNALTSANTIASAPNAQLAERLVSCVEATGRLGTRTSTHYNPYIGLWNLLNIFDLQEATARAVFTVLSAQKFAAWASGEFANKLTPEFAFDLVAGSNAESVLELVRQLSPNFRTRTGDGADTPHSPVFARILEATFERVQGYPKASKKTGYYSRSESLDNYIGARLAAAFGLNHQCWQAYWMLFNTAAGTASYADLVEAAKALA